MKNFIEGDLYFTSLAKKSKNYIKTYHVDREKDNIYIEYFNGSFSNTRILNGSIETLDKEQEEQFLEMKKEVVEVGLDNVTKGIYVAEQLTVLLGAFLAGGMANVILTSIQTHTVEALFATGASVGLFTLSGYLHFDSEVFAASKIKREIKDIDFIIRNKELATSIIREEVDKRRVPLKTQNLVLPYPDDAPYSEYLYQEGINLSTIDDLSKEEQKHLQKMIKRKQFQKRFNKDKRG